MKGMEFMFIKFNLLTKKHALFFWHNKSNKALFYHRKSMLWYYNLCAISLNCFVFSDCKLSDLSIPKRKEYLLTMHAQTTLLQFCEDLIISRCVALQAYLMFRRINLISFDCYSIFSLNIQFSGVRLSEGKLSGLSSLARWGDALLETKWELHS